MRKHESMWMAAMIAVLLWTGMTAEAQTCVAGRPGLIPFLGNSNPEINVPAVTIYTNDLGRQNSGLQAAAGVGASTWNSACPRETYGSIPSFGVNWTSNRGSGVDAERAGIVIDFQDASAHINSVGPPADVSIASWTGDGNRIIAYRRCPDNVVLADLGCTGSGNQLINWNTPYGQTALAHEIGHALGLDHDRTGGGCPTDGLMSAKPQPGAGVLDTYCRFADRANDDKSRCNSESPASSETHPCEAVGFRRDGGSPTDGIGDEFCGDFPWLCDGGAPTWAGGSPTCNYFCVSYLAESHCEWGCSAPPVATSGPRLSVQTESSDDGLHFAPILGVDQPAAGATVSGVITLSGHAHEFFFMPLLEFGADGVTMPVTNLQTGLYRPNVVWHPQGNQSSGFTAKFDTRRLTNGQHTLQITATDVYGFPTKLERVITTNNTCFDYTIPVANVNVPSPATGVVTVTANASDNNGVTKVDFYVDGVYKATDNAAPFVYSWDTNAYKAGTHTVEARAHDGCGNIGINSKTATVQKPANAAQFISQSGIPSTMTTGQSVTVSVTMKNIGSANWTAAGNHKLGVTNPDNNSNWGPGRVLLAANESIAWNQQKTFTWTITAPTTSGTYAFQWRMVKEMVEWFGDLTPVVNITVTAPGTVAGYQGCYTDQTTRALPVQLGGTTHTIESCKQAAAAAGYAYAGLQWYGYCFAGNTLAYSKVPDSECNTPCSSNGSQMCGGSWRNSVYATGVTPQQPLYRGNHDSFDCSSVTGWACNVNSATPINVDIYDGSTFLASVTANQQRESAVGMNCGGYAARGFSYTLPASIRNNASHSLSVRFPNAANLPGSPRTSYCAGPPQASAEIAWIQPAENSWGTPGTLTAAGLATNGTGNVQLVFRERASNGVWGSWQTVPFQATPNANGQWSNTISSGSPTNKCNHFDAYVNYSGVTSPVFHYTGWTGCSQGG